MKKQIAGIFGLLAGLLSVNLFAAPDAAAHDNLTHEEINTPEECEALGRDDRYKEDHYWEVDYDLQGSACTHRYHFDDAAVCEHNGLYLIRGSIPLEACECGEGETMRVVPGHELNECILTPIPQFPLHPTLTRPAEPEVGEFPPCGPNEIVDECVCPVPVRVVDGVCGPEIPLNPSEPYCSPVDIHVDTKAGEGRCNRPCSEGEVMEYGNCESIEEYCTPNSIFTREALDEILWKNHGERCPTADGLGSRTPDDVLSTTGAKQVQEAAAQLGIARASYAPVQIQPEENRLPEYASPAALLGVLAFSSLYPDYELGSSFNYSGENGSLDWEAGMRGDFHHGSFSSYVSAIQSDSGFVVESGTTYRSDSFLASYTTVEAKDYMSYAIQLSSPWSRNRWSISPNLSSEFEYDRDENHSNSESGAGLDLEYRF